MLSTYLNGLLTTGFRLRRLAEPTLRADEAAVANAEVHTQVPPVLGAVNDQSARLTNSERCAMVVSGYSRWDAPFYRRPADEELQRVQIERHEFHPEGNHRIRSHARPEPGS